ncbi:uncharacterized protein [Apostichopus japonicus]|uniref:uncharacterized protein isoform X2 n=1 Tax=Stichopus japonicus TaxID=307972 RepID=UPI003AB65986
MISTMAACLQRDWQSRDCNSVNTSQEISVVSYNILAECNFDDLTYPFCPSGHRGTYERHPKLMMELKHHKEADIICLQEAARRDVDIWRQEAVIDRCNQSSVGMISTLKHIPTGREICVMNIHLLWKTKEYLDINTLQAAAAVRKLTEAAGGKRGIILCGDFNHTPQQPGYDVIANGSVSHSSILQLQEYPVAKSCLISFALSWFQHSQEDLLSAYLDVLGSEPSFTEYTDPSGKAWLQMQKNSNSPTSSKMTANRIEADEDTVRRWSKVKPIASNKILTPPSQRRTLDYIWFGSNHLVCERVLKIVKAEAIEPHWACPNVEFPSDHMLIRAVFTWKELI